MLFDSPTLTDAFAGDDRNELRIELAAVGIRAGSTSELLVALEARRDRVNEAWLRAAVFALANAPRTQQQAALEVIFGPLHHAITDDRLPQELWKDLGKIAPVASDPALRLRRLLVARAREDEWSSDSIARALRGSGPYVKELKAEIDGDDDDPFVTAAKAALKALKRLVG